MINTSVNRLHFPAKIYLILENESPDIIAWHPNNRAFRIVDQDRFGREIIPKYFRHNQMSSVQRQLNLYGFRCVSRGEDKGSFYHPKFQRGDWESAKLIRRSATTTPFGLQQWKIAQDAKAKEKQQKSEFVEYENAVQSIASAGQYTEIEPARNMNSTFENSDDSVRSNDLVYTTQYVEKMRPSNVNIASAFNNVNLASELVYPMMPAYDFNYLYANMLTEKFGAFENQDCFRQVQPSNDELFFANELSRAASTYVFPEYTSKPLPAEAFEEMISMCRDLDSFLQDVTSGQ